MTPDRPARPASHFRRPAELVVGDHLPAQLRRRTACVEYVVDRLTRAPITDIRIRGKPSPKGVPLRQTDMTRIFGKGGVWIECQKALIVAGIMECDGVWKKGEKAMHYRLGETWRDRDTITIPVDDQKLLKKLVDLEYERRQREEWEPIHDALCAILGGVSVDMRAARPYICQTNSNRHYCNNLAVQAINAGEFRMVVCPYGRVHTNITNLSSKLRCAVLWFDTPMVELDIAGCQPLLLALATAMIHSEVWSIEDVIRNGKESMQSYPACGVRRGETLLSPYVGENLHLSGDIRMPACKIERDSLPHDLREFLEVCEDGRFYEELAGLWGMTTETSSARKLVKTRAFRYVFYGPVRDDHVRWHSFRERWPTVAAFLETIKTGDYSVASHFAQRLESALMIRGVCEDLLSPDALFPAEDVPPLITIHDSIMTLPRFVPVVVQAIEQRFGRFGVRPTVRAK